MLFIRMRNIVCIFIFFIIDNLEGEAHEVLLENNDPYFIPRQALRNSLD